VAPPVAPSPLFVSPIEVTVNEDTPVIIDLRFAGQTVEGVGYAIVTQPAHGMVCTKGDGRATYTPDQDFNGTDSFAFKATSGSAGSSPAVVQVSVTPTNDSPVAHSSTVTAVKNKPASFVLWATDPDGDSLIYSVDQRPTQGELTGVPPRLTYQPNKNFVGMDSFSYSVTDGKGRAVSGRITVVVNRK
jgi:hypothetical protein